MKEVLLGGSGEPRAEPRAVFGSLGNFCREQLDSALNFGALRGCPGLEALLLEELGLTPELPKDIKKWRSGEWVCYLIIEFFLIIVRLSFWPKFPFFSFPISLVVRHRLFGR